MAEESNKDKVEKLRKVIGELNPDAMISGVVLRPKPLGDIKERR